MSTSVKIIAGIYVRWPGTTLAGIVSLIAFAVWQRRVLDNPRHGGTFCAERKRDVN